MRHLAHILFCTGMLALIAVPATAKEAINYQDHIRPIFQQSCFNCHNADKAKGGLDLTSYRATLAGGSSGEIVMSQSSDQSSLLGVMNHTLAPKMPPNGDKVADDKLELVKAWIEQGLRETANSSANKPKKPRVDLSVGKAVVGRPLGPPTMPEDMPLGPIHHTPRPGAISDIAGHPWSPIVAVTGQKQVLIYHTDTNELLGVLPFTYGQPRRLRFSWTGKLLLVGGGVGGSSGTVALYDVKTGQLVSRIGDEVDEVLAADLDPTQRFVALGGPSKRVKGFDVATGNLVYNLDKHTDWVTSIAFSPNGDYLASADRNGGIQIWEADTGLHVHRLDGHDASVTALAWRYDGKVLASSGEDGQARIWEMKNGKQVKNWGAHSGGAMAIAYAEDGRLVTTGRDKLIRVWDANGRKKFETKQLDSIGLSASFDTHAKAVFAGDLAGKLVRWSLQDKAQQVDALSANPPAIAVALSRSTEAVATRQAALQQARSSAQAQQAKALQAQQATADADSAIKTLRATIKSSEQNIPKLDQARKQANKQYEQARRELHQSQQRLRQATNTFKAKEGEYNRIQKDHDRAASELKQAKEALAKLASQRLAADQQLKDKPDDKNLIKRIEDLKAKTKQAEQKAAEHQKKTDQQVDRLEVAVQKLHEARAEQQAKSLEVDKADQMEQVRNQEREEANKAYDQERNNLNKAKQQVRPTEDKLKQSKEAQAKSIAIAKQAAAQVITAEQDLAAAQRAVAKWQAAELRLKIDNLRANRDTLRDNQQSLIAERDQKTAEYKQLEASLTSLQAKLAEQRKNVKQQEQDIAKAKEQVDKLVKLVDPAKPETAAALEDAKFDLETEHYALRKLNTSITDNAKAIPEIQASLKRVSTELDVLKQTIIMQPKDPGAKQHAEIEALLPQYQQLRKAAGF